MEKLSVKILFVLFLIILSTFIGCWLEEPNLTKATYPKGIRMFDINGQKELLTDDLLVYVSWDNIIELFYLDKARIDTLISQNGKVRIFKATAQRESLEFIDYKGKVVKYSQYAENRSKDLRFIYFNKTLYLQYVQEVLGKLPSELLLNFNNYEEYEAYYNLMGMNKNRIYGWWCDYCLYASPLDLKHDILTLVNLNWKEPLINLLHNGDLYASVMAAEGLIYLDYLEFVGNNKNQNVEWKWNGFSGEDSVKFNTIINNEGNILVCRSNTTFEDYEIPVKLIFTDSAISEIPNNFRRLK